MSGDFIHKPRDLGLSYEAAAHGVQSAIAHKMAVDEAGGPMWDGTSPKHLRVGIDMQKADMFGLAILLMQKGLITSEEYIEAMRLGANHELWMWEDEANRNSGGVKLTFR